MTGSKNANMVGDRQLVINWQRIIDAGLKSLRQLAGGTESEFLAIGEKMQSVYFQAMELSGSARQLVDVAAGEQINDFVDRLTRIIAEMESLLGQAHVQAEENSSTLGRVGVLLRKVVEPLNGVKRVNKNLYILEVSIKIESATLGDMGSEFINLAMDIKKLSQQIKEKVTAIGSHRDALATLIAQGSRENNAGQGGDALGHSGRRTAEGVSLDELMEVKSQFQELGGVISTASAENSSSISDIVQSMQFHDIYRQQVEHVVEGLEPLLPLYEQFSSAAGKGGQSRPSQDNKQQDDDASAELASLYEELLARTGDVCELQEAQLRFAVDELFEAVTTILNHLKAIRRQQHEMTEQIYARSGLMHGGGGGFIDDLSREISGVTALLSTSAAENEHMVEIMAEVATTVRAITSFVSDIEEIGQEIIQIALNARIKAAATGNEGASLSVLAEEIGLLSNEAVANTDLITGTLTEIDTVTNELTTGGGDGEEELGQALGRLKAELGEILAGLDSIGRELTDQLGRVEQQLQHVSNDINRIITATDIHGRIRDQARKVVDDLGQIVRKARQLRPASPSFKEDLKRMAAHYTMESERRIHEAIAGISPQKTTKPEPQAAAPSGDSDSEFGDNVDLF